jgi:hypothetical protein
VLEEVLQSNAVAAPISTKKHASDGMPVRLGREDTTGSAADAEVISEALAKRIHSDIRDESPRQ